jgi:predicted ATPase
MLSTLAVAGYRSLRELIVPLGRLNVITGANGSGKSSVYRALRLLAETARGGVITSLAREGGLPSTLWAGPERFSRAMLAGESPVEGTRRKEPVSLRLGFAGDEFSYAIDLGMPAPQSMAPPLIPSKFQLDPVIKRECIWSGPVLRPSALLVDRQGVALRTRDGNGDWQTVPQPVASFDSMMTEFSDPRSAPEMITVREQIRSWRFYDHFRTDADAPARLPQIGTHTPVLANDGADLAAALQTIREIGDPAALDAAIDDAFPGSQLDITTHDGRFEVAMRQHGLLRSLKGAELSDGTLRYLLLVAALLTPRPPALLVLNEPETSLHPDLLPALARLIARASADSQVLVVSHAARLIAALEREDASQSIVLEKQFGATRIADADDRDLPAWKWPSR